MVELTKNDYIALIIEHSVNQGYKSAEQFVNYITQVLVQMSTEELMAELEALESNTCVNT